MKYHPLLTFTSMILLTVSLILFTTVSSQAEGKVGASTGFDFSSGDYGSEGDTEITYIPVNLKYQNDDFALKLTVPYIKMSSEDSSVVGGGSNTVVLDSDESTTTETTTESGLGDIVFKGTYFLYEGDENDPLMPMIDLSAKIKLPTADEEKGLGTGETDYALESDFTWFTDDFAIFTTIGYKFMGSNETYDLNNVAYGSIGFAYQIESGFSTGLMYDVKEATSDTGSEMSEATGYVSYKFSDKLKGLLYLVKGFSDGSADYGIGATLSYSMDANKMKKIDWLAPIRRLSDL